MSAKDVVNAINSREPLKVEKALKDSLSTKLSTALDNRKRGLAKDVFSGQGEIEEEDAEGDIEGEDSEVEEGKRWSKNKRFKSSQRKTKADRQKEKRKRKKWAKSAGGKASARKAKKRQKRIKSGSIKVDPKKSKFRRQVATTYKGK